MRDKPTRGPWQVTDGINEWVVDDSFPLMVARVPPERLADAHLIAASPDTRDALAELVRCWDDREPRTVLTVALERGRAALAKARGPTDGT